MQENEMGRESVTITFKADREFAEYLSKKAFELDESKSKILRCCVVIGLPTIMEIPSLVNRVQFSDRVNNNL